MLELAAYILLGMVLSVLFTGRNLAKWNDDLEVVWGCGPYVNNSIFDTVERDMTFMNSIYTLDACGNSDIEDLKTVVFLALCADSADSFHSRIIDRYGFPEHNCAEHFEVTFEVDGCRDHVEGHHIAICKVCGEDVTEQLEEMDDREPEHDDYEEGA